MYADDKRKYVEQAYPKSPDSQNVVLHSLYSLKKYESEWGFDFTLAPIEELQPAFNSVVSSAWIGANNTLRCFRQYGHWRKAQGLPCGEGVFHLQIDQATAIRESMLPSPEQLAALLNAVFDPPFMHTIDIVYRVFLWMGFSGLEDREAILITPENVNLGRMYIETQSHEYPLYDESIDDFRLACELRAFRQGDRMVPRAPGDQIMRGKRRSRKTNTDAMLVHTIRPTLARKLSDAADNNRKRQRPIPVGFGITYNKVYLSGVFYRFYELERLGKPPDFDRYAMEAFERAQSGDKPYKVSVHNPQAAILLRLKKTTATDYANWKRAFKLE